jgi:diaminopimelate decarboxylase
MQQMLKSSAEDWAAWNADAFERLAQAHGTPYFIYDADSMTRRIDAVRRAFCGLVDVFYAVKANPNLALLQALRMGADGLDVSSAGELVQACEAGFDPGQISFAGPAKTTAELTFAAERGVGWISVESVRELRECARISEAARKKVRCAIRVNPLAPARAFGLKMGGKAVQFGIDEERLPEALAEFEAAQPHVEFRGIHVYVGSQCFDVDGAKATVEDALRLVSQIESTTHLTCTTVNLGGGFGVSHSETDRELDVEELGAKLAPIFRRFVESSAVPRRLIFELGRYVASRSGIYVCRVIGSKVSRGKRFFVVDGGLHHHLAAAGTFGAALRTNYLMRNLTRGEADPVVCHVAGPSCNPTDLLGIDVELASPREGDLIGVMMAGSYGLTASPVLFLGRSTPAEWVVHRGEVALGRRPYGIGEFN